MDFFKILTQGKYYYPASSHYSQNESISVTCDRCLTTNLKVCIGFDQYDLCLECISDLSNMKNSFVPQPPTYTKMSQSMFKSNSDAQNLTLMRQTMFQNDSRQNDSRQNLTYMQQSIFTPYSNVTPMANAREKMFGPNQQ